MADEQMTYKGKKILIHTDGNKVEVTIEGNPIPVQRSGGGKSFMTHLLLYKNYSSLMDLAKGVVDSGEA